MSKKVIQFREFGEKNLLDISLCKCKDFAKCVCTIKVPIDERSFLTDQRTARKMAIEIIPNEDDKTYQVTSSASEDSSRRSSICSNESVELQLPKSDILNQPSTSQMRTKLPSLAQACDRTGVSDRSAAILVNSALKDLGIITMEASSKIIDRNPVLQRNGYFGHPENLLLAMLADDRKYIRELGLRRILKCRQAKHNVNLVREFNIPSFNFNADDYFELVSWQSLTITEPPLTVKISDNELQEMISDVPAEIEMLKFPCHSQAVERCVKLVTEASAAVCGYEARDGFIRSRIASRVSLPKFETKGQYCQVLKDN
ncbi:hypothetical protein RN001_011705 [Aquatica leii]|uniref:Uncharacterized protein n=1 Tax=Aquatica leii TaxID=1421715 RepID=A0AAN7QE25_9COLE|nr:hypothetical protein RN001_011705 [Aquatica leii]